ncbi:PREDICTED: kelch-like protein 40b isoform X2 [Drosophila arizonae]|uniref:Kelch-like protein 40b isoform X2 n=1 Tax=Drosophila arizonae TaxID=7263 RepID=A0ABM1PI31_DROAR|nr:PREDICTED: kelch-like protein 40b isoform X2 [Drosophila arizonae]
MDEVMKKHKELGQTKTKPAGGELTCSVHFVKYSPGSSSEDELGSVTRLVSKAEDLELARVFKRQAADIAKSRSLFEFGHNFEDVRDWLTIEQPSKVCLKTVLRYMVENHLKTTVKIEINKMYFNCHLLVLQAYSKYFMELNPIPFVVTLPESKVSQKAFMLVYKWMLSDEPILERKDIVTVFVAATYLRVKELLLHCWKYFDDKNCFNEASACVMYVESRNNVALDVVRNLMLTRIQKFLLTFVATSDFLDLPHKHLVYLLSSDEICVNSEIEILFIAVRWLGHDWERRKANVQSLIDCIRFSSMPLWYLLCVRRVETHSLLKELLSLPTVDSLINQSIAQITSKMYEEKQEGFILDYDCITKNLQQSRRWIVDDACPYYHHICCPHTRDITFTQFESYLAALQQQSIDYWTKVDMLDVKNPRKCGCMQ